MNRYHYYSVLLLISGFWHACVSTDATVNEHQYLNHADTAKYVGITTCKTCHAKIFETYIQTGMGQSFGRAQVQKTAFKGNVAKVRDSIFGALYTMHWDNNRMLITESYEANKLTLPVNYIIGSGQHTNSHISALQGYCYQMPMTYYTQQKIWDLPPGFESGENSRFGRKLSLECISCHNAFPTMVLGSENKYSAMPEGIDCERCHGPGSIHVALRQSKSPVDTAHEIDYSIVNPAKLSVDRQFDICQRCHLQGNMVLAEGASFYDFKPGMRLSDFITVFLPRFSNADQSFIMASHADRLKQSACFINSITKVNPKALKPYKNALTCVSCHNPHVSVKATGTASFNNVCMSCHHSSTINTIHTQRNINAQSNCVQCHMPKSGSSDIPHVSIHDHKIQIPISYAHSKEKSNFMGLQAINSNAPPIKTRIEAYLNQFERFQSSVYMLDSAYNLLKRHYRNISFGRLWIRYYYLKSDYLALLEYVNICGGTQSLLKYFNSKDFENRDAWMWYHIAEAYTQQKKTMDALKAMETAVLLAPYNHEFLNKKAVLLYNANRLNEAVIIWSAILKEEPGFARAWLNMGYYFLDHNQLDSARTYLKKSYHYNPFHVTTLSNLERLYNMLNKNDSARYYKALKYKVIELTKRQAQAKTST